MNIAKQLFKHNKPIIREFGFGGSDIPILWDAYKKGQLEEVPEELSMDQFMELCDEIHDHVYETWMIEDIVKGEMIPVAVVFCKSDGWQFEPHVVYFDTATTRIKLRTYVAFLKKTKYRKTIGVCVVKVPKDTLKLTNKVEEMGLLNYVGKIAGGRPNGNDYIYSVRCNRRH